MERGKITKGWGTQKRKERGRKKKQSAKNNQMMEILLGKVLQIPH